MKSNTSQLKIGDKLSRISYMEVVHVSQTNTLVKNQEGREWSISNELVGAECFTADQNNTSLVVTRTELINLFKQVGDAVFTVNFHKQPKLEDAFDAVANKGKIKSNVQLKKDLLKAMEGEERTLVGYMVKLDAGWGRSLVCDMEIADKKDNLRQVDHRTINWLICRNIKYIVK